MAGALAHVLISIPQHSLSLCVSKTTHEHDHHHQHHFEEEEEGGGEGPVGLEGGADTGAAGAPGGGMPPPRPPLRPVPSVPVMAAPHLLPHLPSLPLPLRPLIFLLLNPRRPLLSLRPNLLLLAPPPPPPPSSLSSSATPPSSPATSPSSPSPPPTTATSSSSPPPPPTSSPPSPRPLLFSPNSTTLPQWHLGPPISPPRRWCAAGSLNNSVYLASGFSSAYNHLVARSAARWPIYNHHHHHDHDEEWEEVAGMRNAAFSREAVEAVGWRGKLCMVNVKGNAVKMGVVYDERRGWEGVMERYDEGRDCWELVVVEETLKGAVQMAAGGGRVCVVCAGGTTVVVVDVLARPGRVWLVDPPPGNNVIAVHVLPRISAPN
ncbi:hypothetical protein Sjap_004039 [Stephania japonica]|uniref:Uncharacterized protein n=1 Tax=Stephania japonica TaxID=461633 RepID=A0AAP0K1K4_9MAGN